LHIPRHMSTLDELLVAEARLPKRVVGVKNYHQFEPKEILDRFNKAVDALNDPKRDYFDVDCVRRRLQHHLEETPHTGEWWFHRENCLEAVAYALVLQGIEDSQESRPNA